MEMEDAIFMQYQQGIALEPESTSVTHMSRKVGSENIVSDQSPSRRHGNRKDQAVRDTLS
jgi:hypothetical protein